MRAPTPIDLSNVGGKVTPPHLACHAARASGGASSTNTQDAAVDPDDRDFPLGLDSFETSQRPVLQDLAVARPLLATTQNAQRELHLT
jgi:2,4-dienoyl-CoA reductase-like NADH-dependent reductase (Old Yellow Enzyme family)